MEETPLLGMLLSINPAKVALFYSQVLSRTDHSPAAGAVCWCGGRQSLKWELLGDAAPEAASLSYLAALQGEAVLTPPPSSAPSEMGTPPRAALGLPRKPAKFHSLNAVWKNLFT